MRYTHDPEIGNSSKVKEFKTFMSLKVISLETTMIFKEFIKFIDKNIFKTIKV
jgi:hypothetical protein